MKEIFYMRREIRLVSLVSQPSGIISRDNPPSDFLFSFTGRRGEDTPEFGRSRDAPSPVKSRPYYTGREATTAARSRGYLVLCSRFPVRLTRDPLHTGSPLVPHLPASAATAAAASGAMGIPNERRVRRPERWVRARSRTARYDALFECGSRLGRGSSRTDRHSRYPSCRGIPRFVNIPPNRSFRRREPSRWGPAGCTWPQLLWQTGRYPVDCSWSFVSTDKKLFDIYV